MAATQSTTKGEKTARGKFCIAMLSWRKPTQGSGDEAGTMRGSGNGSGRQASKGSLLAIPAERWRIQGHGQKCILDEDISHIDGIKSQLRDVLPNQSIY